MQYITQSSEEGFINIVDEIGGEDNDASITLYMVQQHPHIHVGIAISRRAINTEDKKFKYRIAGINYFESINVFADQASTVNIYTHEFNIACIQAAERLLFREN